MKRKTLISIAVIIIMLLNTIVPLFSVYAAETKKTVTFNSELYNALADYLMDSNLTGFTYNTALRTITGDFSSVETLNLKESNVDDLTGIENFTNLKTLNLSGNKLSLDSNLEVLNGISSLKNLDLSTNQIDGFSWLTLDLETENFQNQEITAVKLIQIERGISDNSSRTVETDYRNKKVVQETEGLLAEFDLASSNLDVDTYMSTGNIWNAGGTVSGVQEGKKKVLTDKIDYDGNKITLYNVYDNCRKYYNEVDEEPELYNLDIKVVNSKNKYFGSKIDLYYIVYEEGFEGIVFKDENFYKVVKKACAATRVPVSKKVLINRTDFGPYTAIGHSVSNDINSWGLRYPVPDLSSANSLLLNWLSGIAETYDDFHGSDVLHITNSADVADGDYLVTLDITYNSSTNTCSCKYELSELTTDVYSYACYDKALTLVISKEFLYNYLTSVLGSNKKIKDITGLEKLVGLNSILSLSYNYIDSIDRVIELEENKEKAEKEIRETINELISRMTSDKSDISENTYNYIEMIKKYKDKKDEIAKKDEEIAKKDEEIDAVDRETPDPANGITAETLQNKKNNLVEQRRQLNEQKTTLEQDLAKLKGKRDTGFKKLCEIMKKMKKTWKFSNNMQTYLTPEVYELYHKDGTINESEELDTTKMFRFDDKEEGLKLLKDQLLKLQKLENEQDNVVNQSIAKSLVRALNSSISKPDDYEKGWVNYYVEFYGNDLKESVNLSEINYFFRVLIIQEYNEYKNSYVDLESILRDGIISDSEIENNWEKIYDWAIKFNSNNDDAMLSATIKLPRIKTLDLSTNIIESINGLDALSKLERFDVSNNLLTTIDDVDWASLEKLEVLRLGKNQLTDIDKLSENEGLEYLDVSDCLLSGKFKFDFARYYPNLKTIIFDGNYYDDLSFLVGKFEGKAKKSDQATSIADYITNYLRRDSATNTYSGIYFSFKNQKVTVDYGTIKNPDSQIVFDLPQIFRDIEEMDPYNTTFGIVPGDGSVDEYGKKVMFSSYQTGKNTGVVTVKNVRSTTDSVGLGTYCNIKYDVVLKSDDDNNSSNTVVINTTNSTNTTENTTNTTTPNTPDDTDKPNDTDTPTTPPSDTPGTTENGEVELTKNDITISGDTNDEKFVYVTKPNATVKSLVKSLKDLGYTVNSVGNIENPAESTSRVYTKLTVSLTSKDGDNESTTDAYELVVFGDVDGDGDVDSIDSGYARALRYDKLYEDITDTAERSELMQAFKQTAHFKAADINKTGAIEKEDTRTLLFYRAGLISKF